MKLKKLFALILACMMALSLFTACGGDDEAEYEDNMDSSIEFEDDDYTDYEDEELTEDEYVSDGEPASSDLIMEFGLAQYTLGQAATALSDNTPEDVAALADEIMAFEEDCLNLDLENATEDEIQEYLDQTYYYIGIMSPYIEVAEDGSVLRKE